MVLFSLFFPSQERQGYALVSSLSPIPLNRLFTIERLSFQRSSINLGDIHIILSGPHIGTVSRYNGEDIIPKGVGKVAILRPDLIDIAYLYHLLRSPRYQTVWNRYRALNQTLDHLWLELEAVHLPELTKQWETAQWLQKADRLLDARRKSDSLLQQALNAAFVTCFGDPTHNPKGFRVVTLGDAVMINPTKREIAVPADLSVPYIKMKDLKAEGFTASEYRKVGEMWEGNYSFFANGDVLFPKNSPSLENGIGCVVSGLDHNIGFGSNELLVLRPVADISHGDWLRQLLYLPGSRMWAEQFLANGASYRRISSAFLKSWKVPLPPIERQREFSKVVQSVDAIRRKQIMAAGRLMQLMNAAHNKLS